MSDDGTAQRLAALIRRMREAQRWPDDGYWSDAAYRGYDGEQRVAEAIIAADPSLFAPKAATDDRTWAERHGWPPGSIRDEWNDAAPKAATDEAVRIFAVGMHVTTCRYARLAAKRYHECPEREAHLLDARAAFAAGGAALSEPAGREDPK